MRVGIGYDIHALKKGRKLILGGCRIPYPMGLWGHSDGDALLHALVDAVFGAMAEGDIGAHFPDTDKRNKDADSRLFVEKAKQLLSKKRLRIVNMDATVVAEAPQLMPYRDAMRKTIAESFGVKLSQVGLKAKRNEGFGAIGEKKAIACFAVVSLSEVKR